MESLIIALMTWLCADLVHKPEPERMPFKTALLHVRNAINAMFPGE